MTDAFRLSRGCRGKRAYINQPSAAEAAVEYNARMHSSMRAYECENCPNWHIGHRKNKKRKVDTKHDNAQRKLYQDKRRKRRWQDVEDE